MTSIRPLFMLALIAALTVTFAAGARAQVLPDVSGPWSLSASAIPAAAPEGEIPCIWQGGGVLDQDGSQVFSQDVSLTLVSGPPGCPTQMNASLTGSLGAAVAGAAVPFNGTLTGQLGVLDFSGLVDPQGQTMTQGTLVVRQGPFSTTTGSWDALRGLPQAVIPTLSTVGLGMLILLLLGVSLWMLRQRRQQTA
jgi:hypothetical protein